MTRTVGFVCCAFLLASPPMLASTGQKPAPESTPVTRTATIEFIDKANRTVTLKGPAGNSVEIKAPEQMEGFNSLRVGDQVTATYFAAIAVNLRKPGDPAPAAAPTTTTQRKDRTPIRDQEAADVHGNRGSHRREGAICHRERATGTCRPARGARRDAAAERQNRGHSRCDLLRVAADQSGTSAQLALGGEDLCELFAVLLSVCRSC